MTAVRRPRRVESIVDHPSRLTAQKGNSEKREAASGSPGEEQRRTIRRETRQVVVGPVGERDLGTGRQLLQPDATLAVAIGAERDRAAVGRACGREIVP